MVWRGRYWISLHTQGAQLPIDDNIQSLHPNLARLAADYDDIVADFSSSRISVTEARARIRTLVARDDEGTQWTIDPDSADWCYRDRSGNLRKGVPPAYGHASPNPHSISRPGLGAAGANPDRNVVFSPVNEDLLYAPDSLVGSTRRMVYHHDTNAVPVNRAKWLWLAVLAVLLAVVLIVGILLSGGGKTTARGPTTPGASTTVPVAGQTG